jgi:hypothetical protein
MCVPTILSAQSILINCPNMRPTTSNPKRRHTVGSPTHQQSQDTPRSSLPAEADGKLALRLPVAFEDVSAEVLWSSEPTVPPSILARPHTSNPRYVELNQRDTPRRETGGVVLTSAGGSTSGGATSSPQLTPSDNSPDQSKQTQANDGTGVLWACESESIDPALIARPITANPWLRRLFESGVIPEANWSNKGAQILWSSIDVEDWRMLARPHTSNPLLERVAADASDVNTSTVQKASEVLWHRGNDEASRKQQQQPTSSNRVAADDDGVVLVDGDNVNQSADQTIAREQMASLLLDSNTTNPLILSSLRTQSEKIESLEAKVECLTTVVKELSDLLRSSLVAQQNNIQFLQPQDHNQDSGSSRQHLSISVEHRPVQKVPSDKSIGVRAMELGSTHTLKSDVLTYLPDPTPLSVTIPVVKTEYPSYHAPSPPRTALQASTAVTPATSLPSPVQRHVHYGVENLTPAVADEADAENFVVEDNSAIEPRLEGIDDDSERNGSQQRKLFLVRGSGSTHGSSRPESAQPRPTVGSSSRVVHSLRESVDSTRPQSAPLYHYRRTGAVNDSGSTTTFSKDGSNALLLNNKAIVEQYHKLIRSGHPFALKTDFTEMYRQKSEAFGMPVTNREIERKLHSFRSVGGEYLSLEEFSILYLHIAQW